LWLTAAAAVTVHLQNFVEQTSRPSAFEHVTVLGDVEQVQSNIRPQPQGVMPPTTDL